MRNSEYRGVRESGFQAGVNEEVRSGIGVAPPEVDTPGIGGRNPKGWRAGPRADFI